ncbi:methyltransferase family protein [Desulforhopalus singaporensis]|uniref:methyltransferase family protein n=1 Tax=Desulforhopalus singaporensis TaxID=91360 RepID=UPI0015A2BA4C|nr:NnrU family protein [Desulforhopalus singaporensis]
MHSLLITPGVVEFLENLWPVLPRYYRLAYNLVSLLTLVMLATYTRIDPGPVVFAWNGVLSIFRWLMMVAAILLFYGGAIQYDLHYFFGLRQLKTGKSHLLMNGGGEFHQTGVFALTRHPWYLGCLLAIWSFLPEYHAKSFGAAVILFLYIPVGAILEERKIMKLYEQSYGRYRKRVSMLIPLKWLVKKIGHW